MVETNYKGFEEHEMMTKEAFIDAMRRNDASDLFEFDQEYYENYKKNKNEPWFEGVREAVFVKAKRFWGAGMTYYRGLIVLEYGFMDIEAELFCEYDENNKTFTPFIDYFCCRNVDGDNWCSDYYTSTCLTEEENKPKVDWNADDWEDQLQKDMIEKLKIYCERNGYDYTKPVWR